MLNGWTTSPKSPRREKDVSVIDCFAEWEQWDRIRIKVVIDVRPVVSVDDDFKVWNFLLHLEQKVFNAFAAWWKETFLWPPQCIGNHAVGHGLPISLPCLFQMVSARQIRFKSDECFWINWCPLNRGPKYGHNPVHKFFFTNIRQKILFN